MTTGGYKDRLEAGFKENRPRLRILAFRLLGTIADADDALQETWLRIRHSSTGAVENVGGWLTTVTSRVCIDMLRTRKARRETVERLKHESAVNGPAIVDPENEALLAEAIGSALQIVLRELSPNERVAYVLHDIFDFSFVDVASIVARSETSVRQLASRARRRIRGLPPHLDADIARHRVIVNAFLAASRDGDIKALLELLSPDAVLLADEAGVKIGAKKIIRGSDGIAERAVRGPKAVIYALINGRPGLIDKADTKPQVVLTFTIKNDKIVEIQLTADSDKIDAIDFVVLPVVSSTV